jgi:hypothetical protein
MSDSEAIHAEEHFLCCGPCAAALEQLELFIDDLKLCLMEPKNSASLAAAAGG